ncbi:TonB-dependent receptor domain-containing protein [Novosphingobium resinovorum]|uniref:TonB-dependent receptor domain-containing protein n=1 Tax=Novosphingobium resinovorum TaxID=158500 RepID=UPI002ED5876A|nr:TonB-dependent receptor [Novosphingobium resinovorum]
MKKNIALFVTGSILAIGVALPACAQEGTAAAETGTAEATVADIIVTGTRLSNPNFTAPTPIQTLSAENIQARAPINVADALNEMPAFRASRNATGGRASGSQLGAQSLIDMRGLGPERTLVLINGKRHVGTNFRGTFDTALIPVSLIERVDVVTGGASAAYGSDAVAGVANFVLKNHMQGVTVTGQSGISTYGDDAQYAFNMAAGTSFADDRGHIIFGADYARNRGVGNIYTRPSGRTEPGLVSPGGTGNPYSIFTEGVEYGSYAPGGFITNNFGTSANPVYYAFDASGSPYAFNRGTVYGTNMVGSTANYGNSPYGFFQLKVPTSRAVAYGRGEYEFSDSVTAYVEANYGRSKLPRTITGPSTSTFTISRTNPFVPPELLALIPATTTSFTLNRLNTDLGGNQTSQTNTTWRVVGGLEGKLGSGWNWDAYVEHGETKQLFITNGIAGAAFKKAVNNCSESGLTATELAQLAVYESFNNKACAPFNPFGVGQASDAAYDYIQQDQQQITRLKQTVAAFSLSGSPFSLWAGEVSLAVGAEYRRDSVDVVAEQPLANIFVNGNFTTFKGANSVKEGFAEVGVPLLRDAPFVQALDLNAAVRYTDYKLSGSVQTWKLGATWEPTDGVLLRVTRSRDIRAPNLNEIFFIGGGTTSTALVNSIPNGTLGAGNTVNAGYGLTGAGIMQGAGNTAVKPEVAATLTGGMTLRHGGLRASVDYYQIKLKGAIVRLTDQQTINQCAAGNADACSFITFDSGYTSGIGKVLTVSQNINSLKLRGVDFELGYQTRLGESDARIEARLMVNYAIDYIQETPTGSLQYAGTAFGTPRWTALASLGYVNKGFSATLQARGFTSVIYDPSLAAPGDEDYVAASTSSISQNRFAGRIYNNLSISQKIGDNFQLFGVINNMFNVQPPKYAIIAMTMGSRTLNYDLIGRTFQVGAKVTF